MKTWERGPFWAHWMCLACFGFGVRVRGWLVAVNQNAREGELSLTLRVERSKGA